MKQIRSSIALLALTLGITGLLALVVNLAQAQSFSLTVVTIGQGTVDVDPPPPYTQGQTVELQALPAPGWQFVGWDTLGGQANWWNANWSYRIPVTVSADGTQRKNRPAEVLINFDKAIAAAGRTGTVDPNSVRILEVDSNGNVIDEDVPFQYDPYGVLNPNFDPNKPLNSACQTMIPGQGTVVFILKGTTGPNAERSYHVYFDVLGKGIAPPVVAPQLTLTDDVFDPPKPDPGSQKSFKVETAAGTYFYQKQAAGFSSLDDANGNDWISYSGTFGSGFAGENRGIPNLINPTNGGHFHPGMKTSNTCLVNSGPLKVTMYSVYKNNQSRIRATWELYPAYARMTVLESFVNYWFLYEGTPGGAVNATTDFTLRPDGTKTPLSQAWSTVLTPEQWVVVGDPGVNRSFFMAQHGTDTLTDSYQTGGGLMTVLGFGRNGGSSLLPKEGVPQSFTIGLIDTVTYDDAAPLVRAAYKTLPTTAGPLEVYGGGGALGNQNPAPYTITGNNTVTATFAAEAYQLTLTSSGLGTVVKTPQKPAYAYGDEVEIAATPDPGWIFAGWEGDTNGIDPTLNPQTITMTTSRTLNAKFLEGVSVTTTTVGEGTILLDPPGGAYLSGQSVTFTAVPAPGWTFANWNGLPNPTLSPQSYPVISDLLVTANFVPESYTLAVTSGGNGTVGWEPVQQTYAYGDQVTLTATPDPGYRFAGWSGTISSPDATTVISITGNTAVTASFTELEFFKLDTLVSGQGSIVRDPDAETYAFGTVVELTPIADTGWTFTGWSGDLTGAAVPGSITMTKDATVTATFAQNGPFTLDVVIEGQGTVGLNPDKAQYSQGEIVTLTPSPLSGWVFAGWSGDLTGSANPASIEMNGNRTVTASFVLPSISGPASDNFDACILDERWTFVNPLGDATVAVNEHRGVITVPAGVAHNVFTTGNDSARIMQETENEDFGVEVKFESRLLENGAMQGMIVEQDAQNFMRFDFFRRNDAITVYAAAFTNLTAVITRNAATISELDSPLYLRVVRAADTWEMLYSLDGANWTSAYIFDHALVVQQVGVFAGNFPVKGTIPAHAAAFDYFHNLSDPTKPGDQSLLTVNISGNGQVQRAPAAPYTCGQTVTLTAVPNSGGQFTGWSGDASGTQNPLPLVLNERKLVTATFAGGAESFKLALPVVVRP